MIYLLKHHIVFTEMIALRIEPNGVLAKSGCYHGPSYTLSTYVQFLLDVDLDPLHLTGSKAAALGLIRI
jgi:hypothetical protein